MDIVAVLICTGHAQGASQIQHALTPLHLAAAKGHVDLLPLLLKAGYHADAVSSPTLR